MIERTFRNEFVGRRRRMGPRGWVVVLLGAAGMAGLAVPLLTTRHLPASLLLVFLLVPAAQLVLTPVWRWAGIYRYHSPALFVVERGAGQLELHGGTAFDYLLHLRWAERGAPARRILLGHYLAGLSSIIDDIQSGRIPADARITGTSYFFSDRSAARLGFALQPPSRGEVLHALLDIVSLSAMYSYVHGRPAIPRVWRARQATITARALARRKRTVQALRARLARSVPPSPPPGSRPHRG
jgi:hypothetical protein